MAIIPSIPCRKIATSLPFYTNILDFTHVDGDDGTSDPAFCVLDRDGDTVFLSSYEDRGFGTIIVIMTHDVDALFWRFRARGLQTPGNPDAPVEVHQGPIDQTWGTREFYVEDPDGNSLRFTQMLRDAS